MSTRTRRLSLTAAALTIVLNEERIRHWLDRGAQPSNTVKKLLKTQGISTS